MRKITEFTASQYQLEQNQVQPPDALIQSVQLRIKECELTTEPKGLNQRTARLIATLCLVAGALYFLGTNQTTPDTVPVSNQPNETSPLEEEPVEQLPPIEDEGDESENEQVGEPSTNETQEVEEDIEPPPPRENGEQENRDERFRIRIRPVLEE